VARGRACLEDATMSDSKFRSWRAGVLEGSQYRVTVMPIFCCGYDGNQAPGCGAGIDGFALECFSISWVDSCDVAGRHVSIFYRGWRLLP
jgi:hypothetical protein